jgi:glycosyltransferase involved in cell wall biosynthesis
MDSESKRENAAVEPAPFFSVVLSVYNGQTYVAEAIDSVLAQTDDDLELVIIDDCSTDETPKILADYAAKDKRVRVLSNEQNMKAARSLNRAIRAARGKWIAHIDADDFFTPGYLQTLRAYAETVEPDCFISSWITVVDETGSKILDLRLPTAETIRRMMHIENFIYHPATSFSKQLWEKVGGYPEGDPAASEDTAMWNRFFSAKAKLVMIPEVLVNYRLHYANMTSIKDAELLLNSTMGAQDWRMIRQNREWRASLYLKQKMLKLARIEILKIAKQKNSLSLKNMHYYLLTFLPESFVSFYMWEVRPELRRFAKNFKRALQPPGHVQKIPQLTKSIS